MKQAQHPLRAASELIIPSYARRRPAARELIPKTRLILHPGCMTPRWSTTGAPSYRPSLPCPNVIRDLLHETHDQSAQDHIHKRAMRAMVEQRFHAGEGRLLGAHNRHRTMYRRKVKPSSPQSQYLGRCSPQPPEVRPTTTVSTWIPSHRCPRRFRYG
jgi:hypothetical protein